MFKLCVEDVARRPQSYSWPFNWWAPSGPASANWWIVRASDGMCVVVDIEPKDGDINVSKVGKDAYRTRDEAETEVKRLCKD